MVVAAQLGIVRSRCKEAIPLVDFSVGGPNFLNRLRTRLGWLFPIALL